MNGVVNAFTVNVEEYFRASALPRAIAHESWAASDDRAERGTDRVLSALAERGVRGTFFVLGGVAKKSPALVKRIAAARHEIACHGFTHELIDLQSQHAFRAETERAKHHLEDLIGVPVFGYRAASFSSTRDSLWALDALIDLGFEYDASGIPGGPQEPGTIPAPSGRMIAEFPMVAAEYFGLRLPVSGGRSFRICPYWLSRAGLQRINSRQRRPFAFSMHPWEIGLPRFAERMMRLLGEFPFATMREVLESRSLLKLRERVPTVHEAPPPDAPYVGPDRRRRIAGQ